MEIIIQIISVKFKLMKIEIIDNFLKENHLNSLNALKLDEVKADELKVYHNQIKDGKVTFKDFIPSSSLFLRAV